MADKLTENAIEQFAIEVLERQGFHHLHGAELAPDALKPERASLGDVFLEKTPRCVPPSSSSRPTRTPFLACS